MAAINTSQIRQAETLQKAQELAAQQFGGQLPRELQGAQTPGQVADGIEQLSGPSKSGGPSACGGCSACGCKNGQCGCSGKCQGCTQAGNNCVNGCCNCTAPSPTADAGAAPQQPVGDVGGGAPQQTAAVAA
ncbi:hypothetical protein JST97_29080 [bacterium]|nr:hypothetical protein [bacterium]